METTFKPKLKNCLVCGASFNVKYKSKDVKIYCSQKCYKTVPYSDEKIEKIRNAMILRWKNGSANGFKKGHIDNVPTEARKKYGESIRGEKHPGWKNYNFGYMSRHLWMYKNYGKPTTCEHCQKTGLTGKKIHWANISDEYKLDRTDWLRLCASCHQKFDLSKKIYA